MSLEAGLHVSTEGVSEGDAVEVATPAALEGHEVEQNKERDEQQ